MHEFTAPLFRPEGTGTWTYVNVPLNVPAVFGKKGQVRVRGTVNGAPFRGSLMPHGDGTHYLVVKRELRAAAGAGPGETVRVTLEEDTALREMALPDDLSQALAASPPAAAAFEQLSYSHKKEYVEWITGAKRPETRQERIRKALEMLPSGRTPKGRPSGGTSLRKP